MRIVSGFGSTGGYVLTFPGTQRWGPTARASGGMADAHGSGPCVRKDVGVQLPPCPRESSLARSEAKLPPGGAFSLCHPGGRPPGTPGRTSRVAWSEAKLPPGGAFSLRRPGGRPPGTPGRTSRVAWSEAELPPGEAFSLRHTSPGPTWSGVNTRRASPSGPYGVGPRSTGRDAPGAPMAGAPRSRTAHSPETGFQTTFRALASPAGQATSSSPSRVVRSITPTGAPPASVTSPS